MVALEINEIGVLINQLLKGGMFDNFLLQEAVISQAFDYTIDGTLNGDYYSEEEYEQLGLSGLKYIPFSHVRSICLEMIKGKRKPGYFKFVFLLSPKNQASTIIRSGSSFRPEDVTGMFLNLIYKNDILTCTTGISYRIFSLDKTLEKEWDRMVTLFFKQHGIAVEEI